MMKTRFVLVFLFLAGSQAAAQNTTPSAHETETLLTALENGWNQAQLHHDSKALNEMVADTFISTDNDGTFMTKTQFLADNRDLSYAPSLITPGVLTVLTGEFEAVIMIESVTEEMDGSDRVS